MLGVVSGVMGILQVDGNIERRGGQGAGGGAKGHGRTTREGGRVCAGDAGRTTGEWGGRWRAWRGAGRVEQGERAGGREGGRKGRGCRGGSCCHLPPSMSLLCPFYVYSTLDSDPTPAIALNP